MVKVTGASSGAVYFFEIGDTLLRFNSGVLLPIESAPPADGIVRPGMSVIAACIDYGSKHKEKKMLIAGHTDTVGSDEANVKLSRIRAEAVHGMITGDRTQFATACWGPHLTDEQRYPDGGSGKKEGVLWNDYIDVLNWASENFGWPCEYPKGDSTLWDATVSFQKNYNKSGVGDSSNKPIPEYGSFDKKTWGAVYDCYEIKLAELLKTDKTGLDGLRGKIKFLNDAPEKHFVSCGEFKPIEEKGRDNYRSQTNRRVEVMFFDEGEDPEVPCMTGGCNAAICKLNNPAYYQLKHLPIEIGAPEVTTGSMIKFRLHDASASIMQDTFYRYKFPNQDQWSQAKQTDAEGWASIPAPLECAVTNTVSVQWEMLGDEYGVDRYLYTRDLFINCSAVSDDEARLRLHNLGYEDPDFNTSIERFQKDYGIVETGYGTLTSGKLNEIYTTRKCDARR